MDLTLPLTRAVDDAIMDGERALDVLAMRVRHGDLELDAVGGKDRALTLTAIYELLAGPVRPDSRWGNHPALALIRWHLERSWTSELDAEVSAGSTDTVEELRRLAARDRLPAVYKRLAHSGTREDLVRFLAVEGGPDAGFDDLVAACQIGLTGHAKMELAANFWDEMGNGSPQAVHTQLHDDLVRELAMPRLPRKELPVEALERSALCSLLAANHWLQPEMLGALGLIELQAGPRCRLVVQGLDRLDAPAAARIFYEVHADVDPRHGRDWLDNAVTPVLREHPEWGPRILAGARWRSAVNARFYAWADQAFAVDEPATDRDLVMIGSGRYKAPTARWGERSPACTVSRKPRLVSR